MQSVCSLQQQQQQNLYQTYLSSLLIGPCVPPHCTAGTPNIDIEEGYITITHNGRTDTLPYPKQARGGLRRRLGLALRLGLGVGLQPAGGAAARRARIR